MIYIISLLNVLIILFFSCSAQQVSSQPANPLPVKVTIDSLKHELKGTQNDTLRVATNRLQLKGDPLHRPERMRRARRIFCRGIDTGCVRDGA